VRRQGLVRALCAAAVAGTSLALAACGGAPSASVAHIGTTTTTAPANGPSGPALPPDSVAAQIDKFVSCMRHHGVPSFPELVMSPNGGAVPVGPVTVDKNSPVVQGARRDCQSLLPAGQAPTATDATITPKDQADYIKAAGCMRAHGVPDFPDPVFSGNSVRFPPPPGMTATIANSPTFLRAREICEVLIPPGLPYSKQAEGGQ